MSAETSRLSPATEPPAGEADATGHGGDRLVFPGIAESLREAASPGPWRLVANGGSFDVVWGDPAEWHPGPIAVSGSTDLGACSGADAALIVAARDLAFTVEQQGLDLEALHDENAVLRAERARLQAQLDAQTSGTAP